MANKLPARPRRRGIPAEKFVNPPLRYRYATGWHSSPMQSIGVFCQIDKIDKFVFWTPRVLSICFVLFLAMFSLDVFGPGKSAAEIAVGLFMHNIPALILAAVVAVSWKREIVGGVAFILAGFLYIAMVLAGAPKNGFKWYTLSWFLTISGPAFLVGALFFAGWHRKRVEKTKPADKKNKVCQNKKQGEAPVFC